MTDIPATNNYNDEEWEQWTTALCQDIHKLRAEIEKLTAENKTLRQILDIYVNIAPGHEEMVKAILRKEEKT